MVIARFLSSCSACRSALWRAHDDLAARLARLHQAVCFDDLVEGKDVRGGRLQDAALGVFDELGERDLRKPSTNGV